MNVLDQDFVAYGKNDEEIVFNGPYLTNDRELTFKYCSAFDRNPRREIVLDEKERAIELRIPNAKPIRILLRGKNEGFLRKALDARNLILRMLVEYSQRLSSGNEQIIVWETGSKETPFYFTTETILNNGSYSVKFEIGLLHFWNQLGVKSNELALQNFADLHKELGDKFQLVNKEQYKVVQDGNTLYQMTFSDFISKIA